MIELKPPTRVGLHAAALPFRDEILIMLTPSKEKEYPLRALPPAHMIERRFRTPHPATRLHAPRAALSRIAARQPSIAACSRDSRSRLLPRRCCSRNPFSSRAKP